MPVPPATPLGTVPWDEFQAFLTSLNTMIINRLMSPYAGQELTMGLLTGTQDHIQRVREILTLQGGGGSVDSALLTALKPFNRMVMEYQLREDINSDLKIYGWDFVYVDDPTTSPYETEPEPMLRSINSIPEVMEKIEGGVIELIPGNMPPDGIYPPGNYIAIHGKCRVTLEDGEIENLDGVSLAVSGGITGLVQSSYTGGYFVPLTAPGDFVITPSKTGYTFVPTSIAVSAPSGHIMGQDFMATEVV